MLLRLVLAAALLITLPSVGLPQDESAVAVKVYPLSSFTPLPIDDFGPLQWRGGLELSSDDKRFGGFSSLVLSKDGSRLLAVSDRGRWFGADLIYEEGVLTGLSEPILLPILDSKGKPIKGKARNDAEAMAAWQPGKIDGRLIVGYESYVRAGTFDSVRAPFKPLDLPKAVAAGPANRELEGIGRFDKGPFKGSFIAVSELNRDAAGDIRAWIWGGRASLAFTIKRHEDYAITDIAILPDGDILTVERSYGESILPGMAIRRIRTNDIVDQGAVAPELLFAGRAPYHKIDNMEGIAVSQHGEETRVTLISDDNFSSMQRTLVLQFALSRE